MKWITPSWASACVGALIAGVFEGALMPGALGVFAGAGFVVLAAVPVLFAASLLARGIWRGWSPMVRGLVEPHGGAPVLAAWVCVIVLAATVLAFGMFGATILLARMTMFRPLLVGYAAPAMALGMTLVLLVASRPAGRGLSRVFARRGAAMKPWRIALAFAVFAIAGLVVAWLWVGPRLGPIDVTPALTPLAGLAGLIAAHVALGRWRGFAAWTGRIAGAFALALAAWALIVWRTKPTLTLEVWGELPVAGFVIDTAFDIEAIRDDISLAAFAPTERANAAHPDIVVIVVDTVRADRTPMHSGPAQMPFLAELAARGALFSQARAPSNVTRRSIPSMLTGLAPNRVRGRVVGWALRIDPRNVVLAERLSAGGYDTAGFVCCDGFYGERSRTGLSRGLDHLVIEKNGARLAKLARSWIEQRERLPMKKPLFVYMHLLEPHNWAGGGDPPIDQAIRLRMYDRTLNAADKMIADVVAAFRDRASGQAPIVIVTADHGEALGDHGEPFHSTDLYDSQIHVPFSITGPGIAPRKIDETVSLTDLTPTVVELAGFAPPDGDGRSLATLVTGARTPRADGTAYAAMIKDRSNKGGVSMIVRGKWKLIVTGNRRELYDVHTDPRELSDRAAQQPDLVRELAALLAAREQ